MRSLILNEHDRNQRSNNCDLFHDHNILTDVSNGEKTSYKCLRFLCVATIEVEDLFRENSSQVTAVSFTSRCHFSLFLLLFYCSSTTLKKSQEQRHHQALIALDIQSVETISYHHQPAWATSN